MFTNFEKKKHEKILAFVYYVYPASTNKVVKTKHKEGTSNLIMVPSQT